MKFYGNFSEIEEFLIMLHLSFVVEIPEIHDIEKLTNRIACYGKQKQNPTPFHIITF